MISIATGTQTAKGSTLDQPLEHLQACHRRIEERLATLERVIPFLWDRREEVLPALANATAFLDSSGALHTQDEEESVFPRLLGKLNDEDTEFVVSLEADHIEAEQLYTELKETIERIKAAPTPDESLGEAYRQTAEALCALYRRHIQSEDSRLIAVGAVLTPTELREIAAEMKQRRGLPLTGNSLSREVVDVPGAAGRPFVGQQVLPTQEEDGDSAQRPRERDRPMRP